VYVDQNCVVRTRPPGVGEQQVFWIAVVFSHEKNCGWDAHARKSGKVSGMPPWTTNPPETTMGTRTKDARRVAAIMVESTTVVSRGGKIYTVESRSISKG